ncbi:MAG: hypothetical protein KDD22_03840, partial [Bdellovibrionales bacterium]|nr:hypothetical protein [Bdellovibrionales bacterium]
MNMALRLFLIAVFNFSSLMITLYCPRSHAIFETETEEGFFEDEESTEPEDAPADPSLAPLPQLSDRPGNAIPNLDLEKAESQEGPAQYQSSDDNEPLPELRRQRSKGEYRHIQGPSRIKHPNAAKGLTRITRDKTYIYEIPPSPQKHAASIRFGLFDPVNLQNPDTESTFNDNYPDATNPMVIVEYEWQFIKMGMGKVALKGGSGV